MSISVSSLSALGVLMAGWASANKYALLGGLRAAGQLIAYELPLVLAVMGVVIQAGSMNLQDITVAQNTGEIFGWGGIGNPYIFTQFVGFLIFMIAVQAELTQAPFDMPIAESELVSGYMTEYSGFRFAMFFLAEHGHRINSWSIPTTLFLGGWHGPDFGAPAWIAWAFPIFWFMFKSFLLVFVFVWIRASLPRMRYDQLMSFGWKRLIPLTLLWIAMSMVALGVRRFGVPWS